MNAWHEKSVGYGKISTSEKNPTTAKNRWLLLKMHNSQKINRNSGVRGSSTTGDRCKFNVSVRQNVVRIRYYQQNDTEKPNRPKLYINDGMVWIGAVSRFDLFTSAVLRKFWARNGTMLKIVACTLISRGLAINCNHFHTNFSRWPKNSPVCSMRKSLPRHMKISSKNQKNSNENRKFSSTKIFGGKSYQFLRRRKNQ